MKKSSLVLCKAKGLAGFEATTWIKFRESAHWRWTQRDHSTTTASSGPAPHDDQLTVPSAGKDLLGRIGSRAQGKLADKHFYLDILSSTSTKREAKSYISRFQPAKKPLSPQPPENAPQTTVETDRKTKHVPVSAPGVNLGSFYAPTRAVDQTPLFVQGTAPQVSMGSAVEPLHVALVKIKAPESLDDMVLEGIGLTLSQLARLGLRCVVVVDSEKASQGKPQKLDYRQWRHLAIAQADRVVAGIETHQGSEARRLDAVVDALGPEDEALPKYKPNHWVRVTQRNSLLAPLRRGVIPVIAPVGYMPSTHTLVPVDADEIMLALTREFAGIHIAPSNEEDPLAVSEKVKSLQKETSLDRIIVLDPAGGIPAADRAHEPHVFINLEQEFEDINRELSQSKRPHQGSKQSQAKASVPRGVHSSNGPGTTLTDTSILSPDVDLIQSLSANAHLDNMQLLQRTLALLPPSSSAIITTPQEAANSGVQAPGTFQASGVGTRRQRNPLIHNLLTDKPAFSSSLPAGRLAAASGAVPAAGRSKASPTTFVKRGMPLTILPDPRISRWKPPRPGDAKLTLEDPRIDLPRLVHLIDDSFSRKLDVKHYLERVNDRIAGVIIAGEYEGGALLTWETPPGVPDDDSEESRMRKVPYLDKFAVLKRSQGAGGVADIVFNAMVRGCFPNGVCWRSRRDNPVNKWYFERALGTWKIPNSNWTMFWTTEGVVQDEQTFLDYEGVCRSVLPSWADHKAVVD